MFCGWNSELDIPSALAAIRPAPHFALVSMLDSTPQVSELPSMVPLLKRLDRWYATIDGDVVVETSTLIALAEEQDLLAGFDEIWLLDVLPAVSKPADVRITSDNPLGAEISVALTEWMLTSGCIAGLGDGDGLNFVTVSHELALAWHPAGP